MKYLFIILLSNGVINATAQVQPSKKDSLANVKEGHWTQVQGVTSKSGTFDDSCGIWVSQTGRIKIIGDTLAVIKLLWRRWEESGKREVQLIEHYEGILDKVRAMNKEMQANTKELLRINQEATKRAQNKL